MQKEKIIVRLCCMNCHKMFKLKDKVFLDELNALGHLRCYESNNLPIKDRGTYIEIVEKYNFFSELIKG